MEIKSIEVDNDKESFFIEIFGWFGWRLKSSQRIFNRNTRPDGAITIENVTFIHSATETVDFTKLVFERDKKIPHYNQLVDLEEEFWGLVASHTNPKPYMPPHAHTMEDWARHFEPDLRTFEDTKPIHILHGIVLGIWFLTGAVLSQVDMSGLGVFFAWVLIGGAALNIYIWYKRLDRLRSAFLNRALKPEDSIYRSRLKEKYESTISEILEYEQYEQRIAEIRALATSLSDQ